MLNFPKQSGVVERSSPRCSRDQKERHVGTRVPGLMNSLTCCAQLMTRRACASDVLGLARGTRTNCDGRVARWSMKSRGLNGHGRKHTGVAEGGRVVLSSTSSHRSLSLLHQTSHSIFIPMRTRLLKRATKVFTSEHCVTVCHHRASAQFLTRGRVQSCLFLLLSARRDSGPHYLDPARWAVTHSCWSLPFLCAL